MSLLDKRNREGNYNQMLSEQRPKENEGLSDVWEKLFLADRSTSQRLLTGEHARHTQSINRETVLSGTRRGVRDLILLETCILIQCYQIYSLVKVFEGQLNNI